MTLSPIRRRIQQASSIGTFGEGLYGIFERVATRHCNGSKGKFVTTKYLSVSSQARVILLLQVLDRLSRVTAEPSKRKGIVGLDQDNDPLRKLALTSLNTRQWTSWST
jgi:hypothetical protein